MATLHPGQSLTTPGRTIGAGDINLFAGLVGNFTPIHVDEEFAKSSPFGTRIAHGPLAMAIAIGMLTQTGILGERVIGLLNLNWDFCGPVKIDDTIRSRVTLEEQRPTSKPGRELVSFVFEVINQNDQVVQRGRMLVLVRRRSAKWQDGSVTMGDFVMRPDDETTHKPDASVNFNESVYTNGFDTASPVGGWMRLGNRVNEGYAELSVCLYLPDGRIACQFQRPNITSNKRFDAGGLSYAVIEPLKKVSMTFDGELMIVTDPNALRDPKTLFADGPRLPSHVHWTLEAESPVHGGEPVSDAVQTMYGRDFSRGHFNQHARVRGEIRVGSETFPIDGHGWRDHSWGPRYWQAIYWYRLFLANFPNGDGLMLLKITDEHGRSRRVGVLLVNGEYEDIVDMDLTTEWTEQKDPRRVEIGLRTAKRKAVITGEIMTLAPLRNRRKADGQTLESRIAEGFTRFTWNGQQGYGMTEYIERIENGTLVGYPL